MVARQGNVKEELVSLFGEPVAVALKKAATVHQEARLQGNLGVTRAGRIAPAGIANVPIKRNTFYGTE
jgi:hypothetical protein